MSVESAKEFLKKLQEDAGLKKAIEEAKEDTAKVKKIVEDAGFSFTKQELEEAMGVTGSQELTEEDLEKVAGGSTFEWVQAAAGIGGAVAAAF